MANPILILDNRGAQGKPGGPGAVYEVSSQAAQLALPAVVADVCVRTDINATFALQTLPASTLSNWVEFLSSGGGGVVTSVTQGNGLTLTAGDLAFSGSGYDPAGAASTAQSNAEAFAANAGNIASGTINAARLPDLSPLLLTSTATTEVPLTITLDASQTANALNINSHGNSGGNLFSVDLNGNLGVAGAGSAATSIAQIAARTASDQNFLVSGINGAVDLFAINDACSSIVPLYINSSILYLNMRFGATHPIVCGGSITPGTISVLPSATGSGSIIQQGGHLWYDRPSDSTWIDIDSTSEQVGVTYDGGGLAITTGAATKVLVTVPITGTIVSNTLLADQSGSIVIAISKCSFAGFPGSLTSIVASAPPTLSSVQKSTDSTLTGWTTSVTAGDILQFSVTSATSVTRVSLSLQIVGA